MQVCFASMAVVNTANTDIVEVKKLENDIKQSIPLARIMQGQSFDNGDTVTKVELTAHTYKAITERTDVYTAETPGISFSICSNMTDYDRL